KSVCVYSRRKCRMHFRTLILGALAGAICFVAQAQAAPVLVNGGFETGALSPWFQDRGNGSEDWHVTSASAHSGTFSATDVGNIDLRQDFAPVLTSTITEVSFWARHPDPAVTDLAIQFFYSDATNEQFIVATSGSDWNFFDVTSDLEAGKSLVAISI